MNNTNKKQEKTKFKNIDKITNWHYKFTNLIFYSKNMEMRYEYHNYAESNLNKIFVKSSIKIFGYLFLVILNMLKIVWLTSTKN